MATIDERTEEEIKAELEECTPIEETPEQTEEPAEEKKGEE